MATLHLTDIVGVYSSAVACGLKKNKLDLAYIYVPEAYSSAAVFTKNHFAAPCVEFSRKSAAAGTIKAVIVNAGNANAATGEAGYKDCEDISEAAAKAFKLSPTEVAVLSTGVIGVPLPMDKITPGLDSLLAESKSSEGEKLSEAILTTDIVKKEFSIEKEVGGELVQIAGVCKGSGMIAPNMATMLAFLVTNVKVEQATLQRSFSAAVNKSFNMVSVDTDTSTNDSAIIISTGATELSAEHLAEFNSMLEECCIELAKKIALDGEGATKLIEVQVTGAISEEEAKKVALNVVNSPLVKTAIHGADPNWGRIIAAAGKDGSLKLVPEALKVKLAGELVFEDAAPTNFQRETLAKKLRKNEVLIELDLQQGSGSATSWGCDLTKGYIDINVAYT